MDEHKEQDTSPDAEVLLVPFDDLLIADNKNETTPAVTGTETSMPRTKAGNESRTPTCVSCTKECCKCGFPQLEAEPVKSNEQLWTFQVRSRNVDWGRFVCALDTAVRGEAVYLDRQTDFVSAYRRKDVKRELLICHDMMGNYLADRHFISSQKYDDYRFVHWSGVDYFCYFSHEYVTIPPSGWINAAHRHGVPVLGTYIVEGNTGQRLLHEVLASKETVHRTVDALTRLCRHFRFEGWLVNVECGVRAENMHNLYHFVEKLRDATEKLVPHGRVIWYDSIIEGGELAWQNELNDNNVRFFRISHGTLINYNWNDASLEACEDSIQREEAHPSRVFMGIDVFGRGQIARNQSDQTLERIVQRGFSTGIFAPAWCYETLQNYGYNIHIPTGDDKCNEAFLARNERWWGRLWHLLATHPYCELPFYTDFSVGSGRGNYTRGTRDRDSGPFFNLAKQSLQPSVPLAKNASQSFDTVYAGSNALCVENYERAFRLFLTQFKVSLGVLLLSYAYRMDERDPEASLDVVLRCSSMPRHQEQDLYVFCGAYSNEIFQPGMCYLSPLGADDRLPPSLLHRQLPLEQGAALGDKWRIRHYLMRFDGPVMLQDIGLKCRRAETSSTDAYFGAIYVQSLKLQDWQTAQVQGKATIPVYHSRLWNEGRSNEI